MHKKVHKVEPYELYRLYELYRPTPARSGTTPSPSKHYELYIPYKLYSGKVKNNPITQ